MNLRRLPRFAFLTFAVAPTMAGCSDEPSVPQRGQLAVTISGVPTGASPSVVVTGPDAFSRSLEITTTLSALALGSYTVTASPIESPEGRWSPTPATQTVEVRAGNVPSAAAVAYALTTARLALAVNGMPTGTSAAITISGPNGFTRNVTGSQSFDLLEPGTYVITATDVTSGGMTFRPTPGSTSVTLTPSTTAANVAITYGVVPGDLTVTITGLPSGLSAGVLVSGPNGFSRPLEATTTLSALTPGTYTVAAASVATADSRWAPSPPTQTVEVRGGNSPAGVAVAYALATSRLALVVNGMPGGSAAAIAISGPNGFTRNATASQGFDLLEPGTYTITAAEVTSGGTIHRPTPASTSVTLPPSATPTTVTITYGAVAGDLAVTIAGLPAGTAAAVTLTGPGGFTRELTSSTTVTGLAPGTYTLTARTTTSSGGTVVHSPSPASQTVAVSSNATASATITYSVFQLGLELVASNVASPMFLTAPPGDSRLFIVERAGRIRIMRAGQLLTTPFLDISADVSTDGERGLLSMAFDPAYATNGFFYLYFTDRAGAITIRRYSSTPGSDVANPSGTLIISIPHPTFSNHNGGLLMFGPDGMLYIATGDGGGGGDPFGNGQNPGTLLGKMLRLDVRTAPYTVPSTNPFVGQSGKRGEIWALGLRNPWRFDFDTPPGSSTSNLIVADVGQNVWEEINHVPASDAGINYGWNIMEAMHCYSPSSGCNESGLTRPVVEYLHNDGSCSITGGFVYRGSAMPEVAGHFFYSDFCGGYLASMSGDRASGFTTRRWSVPAIGNVVSFGEDGAGELYMLAGSSIYRIVRR